MMRKRWIAAMMMFALMFMATMACESSIPPGSGDPFAIQTSTPDAFSDDNQEQSTLASGESQMQDLSQQATMVSLNMDQAAKADAQTTLDYYQSQLMELSIQGTQVRQNMVRAAATQRSITKQTQAARNARATVQSQAAASTNSAYVLIVSQTAQAQANLDLQATQTAQVNATQTAYSLTATPAAAIQADILRTQNESKRRAWWGEFVFDPLKVFFITLVVLLLLVSGGFAYLWLMPALMLRLHAISDDNDSPLLMVDGTSVDLDSPRHQLSQGELSQLNHLRHASDGMPHVEIVGPSEPSVINWITEAEQQLPGEGWIPQ